jgi:OmpA-OmpF porin, OOP family
MKKLFRILFPGVAAALALNLAPLARAQGTGFYVKGDVGGNITEDIDVESFFGENVSGVKLEMDPGLRGGIVGGFQVTDWFATELELGFMVNEVSSVKGGGFVNDATISNVPFLVNARFQYSNPRLLVTPYAGAGVGGSQVIFDVDELSIGNVTMWGSDSDTVFAWQAFAGLRFALNEQMGLSVEYRYFDAASPSWDAGYGEEFELGHTRTHAFSLAFDFHF